MNSGLMVGIPWGGGDTQPYHMLKNLFELIAFKGGGDAKTWARAQGLVSTTSACTRASGWNFHYLIFCLLVNNWTVDIDDFPL